MLFPSNHVAAVFFGFSNLYVINRLRETVTKLWFRDIFSLSARYAIWNNLLSKNMADEGHYGFVVVVFNKTLLYKEGGPNFNHIFLAG